MLSELGGVPLPGDAATFGGFHDFPSVLQTLDRNGVMYEIGEAVDRPLSALVDARNVEDFVRIGGGDAFDRLHDGSTANVWEKYELELAEGTNNVRGFVDSLKGTMAEFETERQFEALFPGSDFNLSPDLNTEVWDLQGTLADGSDMLVQVKMRAADAAPEIIGKMEAAPDVWFAVSSELFDKIAATRPDLLNRLHDLDISVTDYTHDIHENLELLGENFGIDIPDGIADVADLLPWVPEIVLGIKLIYDVVIVEKDLKNFPRSDKRRLQALRALLLCSRFGITAVLTTAGTAAGSAGGPLGSAAGALGGAGASILLARRLRPQMLKVALQVTGMEEFDLFYFHNKKTIDQTGWSMWATLRVGASTTRRNAL